MPTVRMALNRRTGHQKTTQAERTEEYLQTLDDAAFGSATPVPPKYISPVDPAARWSAADRGKAHFIYSTNYLVDLDNGIIVDVEPTAPHSSG